eukprot:6346009-Amphidinium_carterae.1
MPSQVRKPLPVFTAPAVDAPARMTSLPSWGNLLHHVMTKHAVTMSQMKHTKLYELGVKEMNEKQRIYYKTKKEALRNPKIGKNRAKIGQSRFSCVKK